MRYLIFGIIGFIIGVGLLYSCFAFFWLAFNPALWNETARFMFAILVLLLGSIGAAVSTALYGIYDAIKEVDKL